MLAVLTLAQVVMLRLDAGHEGRTLARLPWATEFGCNIPTPAADGLRLLVTSAYNQRRTALLEHSADGTLRPVWESRGRGRLAPPLSVLRRGAQQDLLKI